MRGTDGQMTHVINAGLVPLAARTPALAAAAGARASYRFLFIHREGMSFKKSVLPAEQDRPAVARRRARWKKYQTRIDPTRLVFIDENWVKTKMAPIRGWGGRGGRLARQSTP